MKFAEHTPVPIRLRSEGGGTQDPGGLSFGGPLRRASNKIEARTIHEIGLSSLHKAEACTWWV